MSAASSSSFKKDRFQFMFYIRELIQAAEDRAFAGNTEFPAEVKAVAEKKIERCRKRLLELAHLSLEDR